MNNDVRYLLLVVCVVLAVPPQASAITIEVTAVVPGCGNGVIDYGEQCDGINLGGATCGTRGFGGGVLVCSSACTFTTASCTGVSSGAGRSGRRAGSLPKSTIPQTTVVFTGVAQPNTTITLLKDAQIVATTRTGETPNFQLALANISGGDYLFGTYAGNDLGDRSPLLTFPVSIAADVTTKVSEIIVEPVVSGRTKALINGDRKVDLVDFGILTHWYEAPNPPVVIDVNGDGIVDLADLSIIAFQWTG